MNFEKYLIINSFVVCKSQNEKVSFRTILYCLKTEANSGKPVLSYHLNSDKIVVANTIESITLNLNGKVVTLQKSRWLNKIYDDGRTYFYMARKNIRTEYVFDELVKYSISKIRTRISFLQDLEIMYTKEIGRKKLAA